MKPSADRVRQLLYYNADTGVFTWKANLRGRFARIGTEAGFASGNQYLRMCVDGFTSGAHQFAWLYMTGQWPDMEVDHINGVRDDNRFANLRLVTSSQNRCNSRPRNFLKGISKHRNSWVAQITVNKQRIYLGCYRTPEEAHAVYCKAAIHHHGKFARLR